MNYKRTVINTELFNELVIKASSKRLPDAYGRSANVFFIDNYAIIKASDIPVTSAFRSPYGKIIGEVVKKLDSLNLRGVNCVPILNYSYGPATGYRYNMYERIETADGYLVMPKAKGEPLWDYTSLNDKNYLLTNIDKHYKASPDKFIKFAQDYNDILEENLEIDPYPNNFLFDENDGTAFVDIRCLENKPKPARIVYGLCAPCLRIIDEKTRETMHDSEYKTIIDKNAAIFDKCVTAMGEIGINKAFIDERLNTKNSTLPEPKLYIAGINEK